MKITTRLIVSLLLVSALPLALIGYAGLQGMHRLSAFAVDESTTALTLLGEEIIQQRAECVAEQVALYVAGHPELLRASPELLKADAGLAVLAVQPVGVTGYTALYDETGVTHFHSNPAIVGVDLHTLAGKLPDFWAILAASLDGSSAAGYYEWQEADGSLRDKYMSCAPVAGTDYRIAATTYIDEFSRPASATQSRITDILRVLTAYLGILLLGVTLFMIGLALWLARGLSRPIVAITHAAAALEQGRFDARALAPIARRPDELGQLARVFRQMGVEVQQREERLQQRVQELKIEIDQSRRERQTRQIVDTEFFQDLQARVTKFRREQDAPPEDRPEDKDEATRDE